MEETKPVEQKSESTKKSDVSKFLTPVAIVLAGIIVASAIIATDAAKTNSDTKKGTDTQDTAAAPVNVKDVKTDGDPYVGKADAKVTLVVWSDYQCPFCKQFEVNTLPQLVKNYADQGKLRIVFKDYQFLGADSQTAALEGHAVWELYPDKYYEWRKAIYQKQDAENGGFGDEASVRALTKTISGIDGDKVGALIAQKKSEFETKINADKDEGSKFGVQGTPGFVTGTQLISGAAAYAKFTAAIDAQLK